MPPSAALPLRGEVQPMALFLMVKINDFYIVLYRVFTNFNQCSALLEIRLRLGNAQINLTLLIFRLAQ